MTHTALTVQKLAKLLKTDVATLLTKLKLAGINLKNPDDPISKEQKNQLLKSLKKPQTLKTPTPLQQHTSVNMQNAQGKKINVVIKDNQTPSGQITQQDILNAKKIKEELLQKKQTGYTFQPKTTPAPAKKNAAQQPTQGKKPSGSNRHKADKKILTPAKFEATSELLTKHKFEKPTAPINYEVKVPELITTEQLAERISTKVPDLIKTLMKMGIMATKNQSIDQETAFLILEEMGHTPVIEKLVDQDTLSQKVESQNFEKRQPIVVIMGHVDHGKTTLIDHLRKSRITHKETGGITQHIGAYEVSTPKGKITFIDTPGHAAFSNMRAHGTSLTDIAILVVAADDGVKPQTIEAINHAQKSDVPIIVAINKIDKPDAEKNLENIKQQLSQHNIISEQWGGEHLFFNISALKGQGIDDLLEGILIQSEIMDIKSASDVPARGIVLESHFKKGQGASCTLIIAHGVLEKGSIIVTGEEYARIRHLTDENGKPIKFATPGMPVEVLGFSGAPDAGTPFIAVENEKIARALAENKKDTLQEKRTQKKSAALQKRAFEKMQNSDMKTLNLLIKADTKGTAYALNDVLQQLQNEKVSVNIIAADIGGINESDINLATINNTMIIGFNVRADSTAKKIAQERNVEIRYYSIIYQAIEDVQAKIKGEEDVTLEEKILGMALVQEVFSASKYGEIAGCIVKEGTVRISNPIRVLRNNKVVYEGRLESLKRFKEKATEVSAGIECGIGIKDYKKIQPGDQIEVFEKQTFHKT